MKKVLIALAVLIIAFFCFAAAVFIPFATPTKGAPIAAYAAPTTALVVIDLQKDMTEKDGKRPLNLAQTDAVIPVVNALVRTAEAKKWPVVYITHEYRRGSPLRLVTRDFLLEGMPGAGMDPRLSVINNNHFVKYRMDAFSTPEFDAFLRKNQVNHLLLTGMAAEECIDRTCRGALNRNYEVTVISDGIASKSDKSREQKLRDYEKYGAKIVQSKALIDGL
jgi:nicotinamidase-related amidase